MLEGPEHVAHLFGVTIRALQFDYMDYWASTNRA
jgi:hypothetical protein